MPNVDLIGQFKSLYAQSITSVFGKDICDRVLSEMSNKWAENYSAKECLVFGTAILKDDLQKSVNDYNDTLSFARNQVDIHNACSLKTSIISKQNLLKELCENPILGFLKDHLFIEVVFGTALAGIATLAAVSKKNEKYIDIRHNTRMALRGIHNEELERLLGDKYIPSEVNNEPTT